MKFRRPAIALVGLASVVALSTGCSTRHIDAEQTGSTPIEGTSWMMFCDGPNAFIWVPGHSGDADELEAVIYDHDECVADSNFSTVDPARGDADGIIEDDE